LSQRAAFCVYSGKGVSELRTFLTFLYKDEMGVGDDSTEYDDEDGYVEDPADVDVETGNEGDDEEYVHVATTPAPSLPAQPSLSAFRGRRQTVTAASGGPHVQEVASLRDQRVHIVPQPAQDRTATILPGSPMRINGHADHTRTSSRRTNRIGGFGHQPIVESSNSPTPSDVASNRSTGTNQSNGAGFFRTYQDAAAVSSARSTGALTPDLDFAEIGHGRGTGHRHTDSLNGIAGPSSSGMVYASTPHLGLSSGHHTTGRAEVLADSSNSYRPITWPHMHRETSTPPPSGSSSRDLHDSVQSVLGDSYGQNRDVEGRGRSVKRSLRNTFQAAENLASSLLFGRQSGSHAGLHDMGGGSGNTADSHGRR
jgi:F-box and leucine-rich repeat protein GRR1